MLYSLSQVTHSVTMKYKKIGLFLAVSNIMCLFINCTGEKITYISVEHPNIKYINPAFLGYANISARRFSRRDPVYYFDFHFKALIFMDNRVRADFYFFEWLTNVYKPTFVEMHFKWCNLIHKDKFFGSAMKQGNLTKPCPYAPGDYHLYNMTIPLQSIPKTFPFTKGRIYANFTWVQSNHQPRQRIGEAFIDMEIKTWNKKS